MLKLYDYFRSSACFRVRIALNLKGLNYEAIPIHLLNNGGEQHAADYQKINPQELVPTLINNHQIVSQSLAIIEYLDELHPAPPLLPNAPYEKARVRAFALSIAADLHPLNNLRVLNYLTHELGLSEAQKNQWYQHWIQRGLSALEKNLSANATTGKFCFGDEPTLADICLVPQLFNAKRFNCDISAYPTLVKIDKQCLQLAAFQNAQPAEATVRLRRMMRYED